MPQQASIPQLVDHLFRKEAGKLVSSLTKLFGPANINLAEDVVQDSLIEAMEYWQYNGVPDNPSAWLCRVARNKALNILNREQYKRKYQTQTAYLLKSEEKSGPVLDHLLADSDLLDDQLRMIFTCCHPAISPDSQVALILKTLCGFSISEIAKAFLTTEENVNKRLVRARQTLREAKASFAVPRGSNLEKRLNAVLEAIYLLFNEGYSASSGNEIIRGELCEEAICLAQMIVAGKAIRHKETVHALLGLMLINGSRFKARQDKDGNLLTLAEQDRLLWDRRMLSIGLEHLTKASKNNSVSVYHIQAAIAAKYSVAPDYTSTDWKSILSLYDSLIELDHSPVVLLNRALVVSKVDGPERALSELEEIGSAPVLTTYYLFYATRADILIQQNDIMNAITSMEKAIGLAPLEQEKELLKKRLAGYLRLNT